MQSSFVVEPIGRSPVDFTGIRFAMQISLRIPVGTPRSDDLVTDIDCKSFGPTSLAIFFIVRVLSYHLYIYYNHCSIIVPALCICITTTFLVFAATFLVEAKYNNSLIWDNNRSGLYQGI